MRTYLGQNVYEPATTRIEWLFREFPNIYVNFSGGKDSTVVLHLTLEVAERLGRLPLNVLFIDQEAEWSTVIDHVRTVMHDPRVRPFWLQVPFKIFNATSNRSEWLQAWAHGAKWIHDREPDSIHENVYGTDRFSDLFTAFKKYHHPNEMACTIAGVRCEESPARLLGLTVYPTYKGETWGRIEDRKRGHYAFYPIYDWALSDVWKAIHDKGWPYCKLYDLMYQRGVPLNMRVSNIHHETAVWELFYVQEIEPDTWNRVVERISGINTVGHLREQWMRPKDLPSMFSSWAEYRDHLLENLITNPDNRAKMRQHFAGTEKAFAGKALEELIKTEIAAILINDFHYTKLTSFIASHMNTRKSKLKKYARPTESTAAEDQAI